MKDPLRPEAKAAVQAMPDAGITHGDDHGGS